MDNLDVKSLLSEIAELQDEDGSPAFIERYEAGGRRCIQIVNFLRHQRPHIREVDSVIPWESSKVVPRHDLGSAQAQPRLCLARPDPITITNTDTGTFVPPPAEAGREPALENPKPDPLAGFPVLQKEYPGLWGLIRTAHPSIKTPSPGTKADYDARLTLGRIVRLDGFTEADVLAAVRHVFETDSKDALFWRQNLGGIIGLRHRCKSGRSKIDHIVEVWRKDGGGKDSAADVLAAMSDGELRACGLDPVQIRKAAI
jgi:hypothetical protein